MLLRKLRNLTSLTSVQYAPRGGGLTEGGVLTEDAREYAPRWGASILKYAPRWGVGVAGSTTSLLTTALPSAGYPTHRRGLGAQYALREGASFLKYAPREGVGVAGSATSLLNTAPPKRGMGAQYAPREGVGVAGNATSLLNTAPPSAGCPLLLGTGC